MYVLSKQLLENLRAAYPKGARVELLSMEDKAAPAPGTLGTVTGVDDTGSILVDWDNGSSLNVLFGIDQVRSVPDENEQVPEDVIDTILSIRESGATNMFDVDEVCRLARDAGMRTQAAWIDTHRGAYVHFILHGDAKHTS